MNPAKKITYSLESTWLKKYRSWDREDLKKRCELLLESLDDNTDLGELIELKAIRQIMLEKTKLD